MSVAIPIGIPITELRPTQMTVGLYEVAAKRRRWRDADEGERAILLRRHVLPAVVGPKGRHYIVDHHHFARALLEEKAELAAVYIVADLEHLPKREFWTYLDNNGWCHAYDTQGKRRNLNAIPKHLGDLADDPYRSLAGALIRMGGCAKSSRRSPNSSGPTICGVVSITLRLPKIGTRLSPMRYASRSWPKRAACRDGVARTPAACDLPPRRSLDVP